MVNQADPDTIAGAATGSAESRGEVSAAQQGGTPERAGQSSTIVPAAWSGPFESFHGRRVSWIAVSIVVAGFLCSGLALIFGPVWWLFWTGGGVAVLGILIALATNMFEDWY